MDAKSRTERTDGLACALSLAKGFLVTRCVWGRGEEGEREIISRNRRDGLLGQAVASVPSTSQPTHLPANPRHKQPVRESLAKMCPEVAHVGYCKKSDEGQGTCRHLCPSLHPDLLQR